MGQKYLIDDRRRAQPALPLAAFFRSQYFPALGRVTFPPHHALDINSPKFTIQYTKCVISIQNFDRSSKCTRPKYPEASSRGSRHSVSELAPARASDESAETVCRQLIEEDQNIIYEEIRDPNLGFDMNELTSDQQLIELEFLLFIIVGVACGADVTVCGAPLVSSRACCVLRATAAAASETDKSSR
ncbi:hypothetical protein EVAR_24546_1 [Eumeta japonica]|uniref:Uncharacterized protein n=1 Tax=Eumeta variegata TaxID=151549 RepID=A0A4C1URM9_EUMVA|nr:hypothetical protein EVAR_24546_1 [Eumeta japonica]